MVCQQKPACEIATLVAENVVINRCRSKLILIRAAVMGRITQQRRRQTESTLKNHGTAVNYIIILREHISKDKLKHKIHCFEKKTLEKCPLYFICNNDEQINQKSITTFPMFTWQTPHKEGLHLAD